MILKRYRLVVVQQGETLAVPYIGADADAQEKEFLKQAAVGKNTAVHLVTYPTSNKVRFPAGEMSQTLVTNATRRIGLETEIEAATAVLATAQARIVKVEEELATAQKSQKNIDEHLAKARKGETAPIHSPESIKTLERQLEEITKRHAARAEAITAAAQRLAAAQAALKEFDADNAPKSAGPDSKKKNT